MKSIENRKAWHDYHILEKFQAGIALQGCEVKSLRDGQGNLRDSFAFVKNEEVWLYNMHISPYQQGSHNNPDDPKRPRKLLLKKLEIKKLIGRVQEKGLTLIPLKVYLRGHVFKVELGLCKQKKLYDKRKELKKKQVDREINRSFFFRG
ncbi:SsrA-binding protein SmpB [Candidatus Margulisiibacteriota bacterium]